jgi:N-carbamoylputrescine amidase
MTMPACLKINPSIFEASCMKATVCELRNDPAGLEADWQALADHTRRAGSALVVLPEMPFSPWLALSPVPDPAAWESSVRVHDAWLARLPELGSEVVVGTRPVVRDGVRLNEGFVWDRAAGYQAVHQKYYLPDEEEFWEASWYARGDGTFRAVQTSVGCLGFLICTEIWFTAHARAYLAQGVDLLVSPRATMGYSTDKWVVGGRAAAVVAGAYCLSSNFGGGGWGGTGWLIEPEAGAVLGRTSPAEPFITAEVDLEEAARARTTYPRYVPD